MTKKMRFTTKLDACELIESLENERDALRSEIESLRAELAKPAPTPPNKVTATAPEVIYLRVSDDEDDADEDFNTVPDCCVGWCEGETTDVSVKYIRADLAGETK